MSPVSYDSFIVTTASPDHINPNFVPDNTYWVAITSDDATGSYKVSVIKIAGDDGSQPFLYTYTGTAEGARHSAIDHIRKPHPTSSTRVFDSPQSLGAIRQLGALGR